ncbi:MAG TPA: M28 family metallopeptidase [Dokdonella sp.]
MHRIIPPALLALALSLAACRHENAAPGAADAAPPAAPRPAPVTPTADNHWSAEITAEDFAARVRKLASDELEGRSPGGLGGRLAVDYIKDQFERIGLKPGYKGSWFQNVPMVTTTLQQPEQIALSVAEGGGEERFVYGKDLIVGNLDNRESASIADSPIVFLGYGVDAPEYQWNDYADIDVKGKTVVVLVNDPGWGNQDPSLFKGKAMTYFGRWTYKFEEAARKGAAACLIVHDTAAASYPWEVVVNSWSGPQFSLPARDDPDPRLGVAGWITTDAARRLFAKAGQDFDALKKSADLRGFKPVALDAKASLAIKSAIQVSSATNVIGVLPGSERAGEAVVYTAHWDHLGKSFSGADRIFNGAVDNASGVAGLLEIAEAFAHQQPPPKRSVLFAAVTLEEFGLLGSRWYATHPSFPLDKTVADINMDALPIIGPTKDIAVIGWGQSDLDDYVKDAAAAEGRTVVPDETPETGFFFRSDQLNFARLGVPVLYARAGFDLVDGGEDAGRKAWADYMTNRYHKPSDEYDPNWDLRGVVDDLKAFYAVGRRLADEDTFPQWKPGADFRRPAAAK